jgi:hypothetical protein
MLAIGGQSAITIGVVGYGYQEKQCRHNKPNPQRRALCPAWGFRGRRLLAPVSTGGTTSTTPPLI